MASRSLMILGAIAGTFAIAMEFTGLHAGVVLFAAGAVFGKGYGIWETRSLSTTGER